MKKAIVFSNWGPWDEDLIGAVATVDVPDEVDRAVLVDIARKVCIIGTSPSNPDVNDVDRLIQVLDVGQMELRMNVLETDHPCCIPMHHFAAVPFDFSIEMLILVHVVE